MNKLLFLLLFVFSTSAFAHEYGGYHHGGHGPYGHYHGGHHHRHYVGSPWGWVVPAVVGGVIVYEATKPDPVPVVVQQAPVASSSSETCGPWTEVQNKDGSITRSRTCQ